MSKSQILTALGTYRSYLARVVRQGFDSIDRDYSATAEVHTRRTTANIRHDQMIRAAHEILPKKDFHSIHAVRRSLFSFKDKFLIQFKKLKPNLTTSNFPTKQADFFDKLGEVPNPNPALPGIGDSLPLVTVGYVPKDAHGLVGIFITHVVNHKPEWVERIDDADADGKEEASISSILPPNGSITAKRSRIRRTRRARLPDFRNPRS